MGVLITLGGKLAPAASYSVTESGTPLYANDTGGSVGSVTITIPLRDRSINPHELQGKTFSINDTRRGTVNGVIVGVSTSSSGGMATLSCLPRSSRLNIHNVKMTPYHGTLWGALRYYLSYTKISLDDLVMDESLKDISAILPGWNGDLWSHIKMLCAAYQMDLTATGTSIIVRKARTRKVSLDMAASRETDWAPTQKAAMVEVWRYSTAWTDSGAFYPPEANATSPVSLTAGQPTRATIELRGSVYNFIKRGENAGIKVWPIYNEDMSHFATNETQFVVTYGNGKRVTKKQWERGGGRLTVYLNPDSRTATVLGVGPVGVYEKGGDMVQSFSISIVSNGITYDALRLRAKGVIIRSYKHTFKTGIPAEEAETKVGVTVDNPFIRTVSQACEAGVDYATLFSGGNWTGTASMPNARIDLIDADTVPVDQQIGNIGGARFYDTRVNSWFRIRSANINESGISVSSADVDNTFKDVAKNVSDLTYEDARLTWYDGLTYEQVRGLGVVGG